MPLPVMPLDDADILIRIARIVPDAAQRVLAEVATIEADTLTARCEARACDGKALGGTCADCPADAGVFDGFLPDPVLDITPAGREALTALTE